MNENQLDRTLRENLALHKKWVDSEGKEGEQLDLSGCELADVILVGANLRHAEMSFTNLNEAAISCSQAERLVIYRTNFCDLDLRNTYFNSLKISVSQAKKLIVEEVKNEPTYS